MVHLVGVLTGLNKRFRVLSIWSPVNAGCELITGYNVSFRILCFSSHDPFVEWRGDKPNHVIRCLAA